MGGYPHRIWQCRCDSNLWDLCGWNTCHAHRRSLDCGLPAVHEIGRVLGQWCLPYSLPDCRFRSVGHFSQQCGVRPPDGHPHGSGNDSVPNMTDEGDFQCEQCEIGAFPLASLFLHAKFGQRRSVYIGCFVLARVIWPTRYRHGLTMVEIWRLRWPLRVTARNVGNEGCRTLAVSCLRARYDRGAIQHACGAPVSASLDVPIWCECME